MNILLKYEQWLVRLQQPQWRTRLMWLLVIGTMAAAALLPVLASYTHLLYLLVLLVGLAGMVLVTQWPGLALSGILLGIYFVSYIGPGGVNAAILGVAGVTAFWLAEMVIRTHRLQIVDHRTTRALLLFFASALLSFIAGQLPWHPLARHAPLAAQGGGLIICLLSGFAFLTMGNLVQDLRWLKWFTWLFLLIGVLYVAARLVPEVANVLRNYFAPGAFQGSLFFVWILVIPLSQALLNRDLHLVWRVALFGFVLSVLYISIIQAGSWKSGYIPPLVGATVVVLVALKKKAIYLLPLLAVAGYLLMRDAIASDEYSAFTRLEAWRIVSLLTLKNPVLGLGFGNYYFYTPLTDINGWRVNFSSHSQYIDLFAQTGILGMASFLWFFGEVAGLGWRLRSTAPQGFAHAYVIGALGGLAGTLVAGLFADWVVPFVYNIGMDGFRSSVLSWFFLGGLVVIYRITRQTREAGR